MWGSYSTSACSMLNDLGNRGANTLRKIEIDSLSHIRLYVRTMNKSLSIDARIVRLHCDDGNTFP